jgi:hypothetical protein
MVNGLCYLNYIEFSLILSLFLLLFRKYLLSKIIGFILSLKNKYNKNKEVKSNTPLVESKSTTTFEENVGSFKTKSLNTLDKNSDFLIVFVFLCLFLIKFINIYYSNNLGPSPPTYPCQRQALLPVGGEVPFSP